jgi:hypothetical protein
LWRFPAPQLIWVRFRLQFEFGLFFGCRLVVACGLEDDTAQKNVQSSSLSSSSPLMIGDLVFCRGLKSAYLSNFPSRHPVSVKA